MRGISYCCSAAAASAAPVAVLAARGGWVVLVKVDGGVAGDLELSEVCGEEAICEGSAELGVSEVVRIDNDLDLITVLRDWFIITVTGFNIPREKSQ